MTKSIRVALAIAFGSTACLSAAISVERRSSGAIQFDDIFIPDDDTRGHFISFPAQPFVNCLDAIQFDHEPVDKDGVHTDARPLCRDAHEVAHFFGYDSEASWIPTGHTALKPGAYAALEKQLELEAGSLKVEKPLTPLFSFLHFSDVQIREPEAKLTNAEASSKLDRLVDSFERSYEQELYSRYTYSAIIETVNAELKVTKDSETRPHPLFMIHTGDAVDAGLTSEFEDFLTLSNRLAIPWYQALGNHDVLAFGNMRLYSSDTLGEKTKGKDERNDSRSDALCTLDAAENEKHPCTCTQLSDLIRAELNPRPSNWGVTPAEREDRTIALAPIGIQRICIKHEVEGDTFVMDPASVTKDYPKTTSYAFMRAHCRNDKDGNCLRDSATTTASANVAAISYVRAPRVHWAKKNHSIDELCGTRTGPGLPSAYHGLDLASDNRLRGYYCFRFDTDALTAQDRHGYVVVLNTTTTNGAYGEVGDVQRSWLDEVLDATNSDDVVMVFGHHPLWDFYSVDESDDLKRTLAEHANVIAYFDGHTHMPELRVVHVNKRGTKVHMRHFWDVTAPSVIGHPQQVRQVTVKMVSDTLGYIEVLSFSPRGQGGSADKIERAQRGAKADACRKPGSCENGEPRQMSSAASYPRLFFTIAAPFKDDND